MRKEQILYANNVFPSNGALKSLDEWAEEMAIKFANYIAFNHNPHDIDTWDEGKFNTHELYDRFINSSEYQQSIY